MPCIEQHDLFNAALFVIDEHFDVKIAQQIQVYFVSIIANGHYESAAFVKNTDLFIQRQILIFSPRNHYETYRKNYAISTLTYFKFLLKTFMVLLQASVAAASL